jgi:hypothetical protein
MWPSSTLPTMWSMASRPAPGGVVGVGRVGNPERDHARPVAVAGVVLRDLVVGRQRAGEDEPDAALLEDVRGAVAQAGLEPRVGDLLEAEGARVVVRGLLGVADPQLDVVDAVKRHEVFGGLGCDKGLRAHNGQ